jgi:formylmethanofuran dehydrogenase subunit D
LDLRFHQHLNIRLRIELGQKRRVVIRDVHINYIAPERIFIPFGQWFNILSNILAGSAHS